jgi:diguanylate cyclase (GGDEF)-like protein
VTCTLEADVVETDAPTVDLSAVHEEDGATADPTPARTTEPASAVSGLSTPARAFLGIVVALALGAHVAAALTVAGAAPWLTFATIAAAVSIAQLFVVITPRNQSYHVAIALLLPAVLLLPWQLAVLVPLVQHLPEWVKVRYPWYIQSFNIGNYTLAVLAAWLVANEILATALPAEPRWALAGLLAAVTFVVVNHFLLAAMLRFARGHSLRATGLFGPDSLSTDLVLAMLGIPVAALSTVNPWVLPAAIAPLILIQRTLAIPVLEEQVNVDPKTGLFNARHFDAELESELARSARLARPLSLIMADLDLLRDLNNTHGHLAGDAVLHGIADVIRQEVRAYDRAARFGGEEFVILLPETTTEEAVEVAERIRTTLERARFEVDTVATALSATISCGVASFPADGADPRTLLHQADLAVYRAKEQGRNQVVRAATL